MKKKLVQESDWEEIEVEFDDFLVELSERIDVSLQETLENRTDEDGNYIPSNERNIMSALLYKKDGSIAIGYFPKHADRTEIEANGPKYVISIEKRW